MEVIEWIEYIDTTLKNYRDMPQNPFPNIFENIQEYRFFVDDGIDLIPMVKSIWKVVKEKYNIQDTNTMKLYIICIYFLCIKFYTDTYLSYPVKTIIELFQDTIRVKDILRIEIKILKAIDYKFPLN